jgi:hypothetical protein
VKLKSTKQRGLWHFISILEATLTFFSLYHDYIHDSNHNLIGYTSILPCCELHLSLNGSLLPISTIKFILRLHKTIKKNQERGYTRFWRCGKKGAIIHTGGDFISKFIQGILYREKRRRESQGREETREAFEL